MKGVMGQINLAWPSAWLKDCHRFFFKRLQHKPSERRKFRGVRFVLSYWASSKGKDLPCFSITQGRALLHSAWDMPYLELPKTCVELITPFSIQPVSSLAWWTVLPKPFQMDGSSVPLSSKVLWKEKRSCWSSRLPSSYKSHVITSDAIKSTVFVTSYNPFSVEDMLVEERDYLNLNSWEL